MTHHQRASSYSAEESLSVLDTSSLGGLTTAVGLKQAEPEQDPLLGRDIGGVTIVRRIAEGGMGRVYEGRQEKPNRTVAVKVMRPGFVSPQATRRFAMEFDILGSLRHPSIAQIFAAGTCDVAGAQVPFFFMEYVPDALPITRFACQHTLGIEARLALFRQVCDAVAHGHDQGIVHRDLKPSNILVEASGIPKIIDFGIARIVGDETEPVTALTELGQLIGTLQYMSPEQIEGDPTAIDQRTDVYALGVILYELLTESRPYEISSRQIFDAARIVRRQRPISPLKLNRSLNVDIVRVTERCLRKNRRRRYGNAAELAAAVGQCLARMPSADATGGGVTSDSRGSGRGRILGRVLAGMIALGLLVGIGGSRLSRARLSGSQLGPPVAVAPFDAARARGHQEAWARHLGVGIDVTNSVGMRLTLIPPGTFFMGADDGNPRRMPVHEVRISQPFFLGAYEVTNAEWQRVMGAVPSQWPEDDRPVEHVSWDDAMDFCRRLSELPAEHGLGRVYRLPTEAEWEYACRAGTTTRYCFGDDPSRLGDYGWFTDNADSMTHPIGLKAPNPWGLYDMHGNVGEWCGDWFGDYPTDAVTDPLGPPAGTMRVRRGGGWISHADDCVLVNRIVNGPSYSSNRVGLRVVLTWASAATRP